MGLCRRRMGEFKNGRCAFYFDVYLRVEGEDYFVGVRRLGFEEGKDYVEGLDFMEIMGLGDVEVGLSRDQLLGKQVAVILRAKVGMAKERSERDRVWAGRDIVIRDVEVWD